MLTSICCVPTAKSIHFNVPSHALGCLALAPKVWSLATILSSATQIIPAPRLFNICSIIPLRWLKGLVYLFPPIAPWHGWCKIGWTERRAPGQGYHCSNGMVIPRFKGCWKARGQRKSLLYQLRWQVLRWVTWMQCSRPSTSAWNVTILLCGSSCCSGKSNTQAVWHWARHPKKEAE